MRGRRPELKPIAGGKGASTRLPALPQHLPKGMRGEWQALIVDLQERRLFHPTMVPAIEAYATALWMIAECRAAIAAEGAFVRTKTGQPKPHPAAGMMGKNLEIAARLAGEFGFTPSSRSRKALQVQGEAPDDDAADLGI